MSNFLESSYIQDGKFTWLKGNLHTHTKKSDGKEEPQEMIRRYSELGYGFLGLSDHDVLADYRGVDPCGMVLLPCNEMSVHDAHLLHIGAKKLISSNSDIQSVLDEIAQEGSLGVMCHPNWESAFNHYTYEELLGYKGYIGIEIFNGTCVYQVGEARATDKWDRLLAAGKKVWGFANDDSHYLEFIGRAWNVVQVREKNASAILEALKNGAFYTSTGVEITDIKCKGAEIYIKAPNAEGIAVIGELGKRLLYVEGAELRAEFPGTPYFRIECFGKGDIMAWTQPFINHSEEHDRRTKLLEEKPVLKALRSKTAPIITGKADDPVWRKAEPTENLITVKNGDEAPVSTIGRCILSGETVYFSVICEEPDMKKLRALPEDSIWLGDSIEIFLDVEAKQRGYFQFIINPDGTVKTGVFPRNYFMSLTELQAKGYRSDKSWSIEAAIPLKTIRASAKPGERWGLNICRNRTPVSGSFTWSFVGNSYHMPTRFGWLEF